MFDGVEKKILLLSFVDDLTSSGLDQLGLYLVSLGFIYLGQTCRSFSSVVYLSVHLFPLT